MHNNVNFDLHGACYLGTNMIQVTGVVVALHGKAGTGDFLVEDVLEAGLPPQIERSIKSSTILLKSFQLCAWITCFIDGMKNYQVES